MKRSRQSILLLITLDGLATLVVFNLVADYFRIADHLLLLPIGGPIAALLSAFYLIGAYRPQTRMGTLEYVSLHGLGVGVVHRQRGDARHRGWMGESTGVMANRRTRHR